MGTGFGPPPTAKAPWSRGKCHYANELEELRRHHQELGNIYGAPEDIELQWGSDEDGPSTEQMLELEDRRRENDYAEVTDDDDSDDDSDEDGAEEDVQGYISGGSRVWPDRPEETGTGSPEVGKLAGQLLLRLAGHSRVGPVMLADAAAAGQVPLPREVAAMPLPLTSLLSLADIPPRSAILQVSMCTAAGSTL